MYRSPTPTFWRQCTVVAVLLCGLCCSAFHASSVHRNISFNPRSSLILPSRLGSTNNKDEYGIFELQEKLEKATNKAIIEKLLCGIINEESSSLVELNFILLLLMIPEREVNQRPLRKGVIEMSIVSVGVVLCAKTSSALKVRNINTKSLENTMNFCIVFKIS